MNWTCPFCNRPQVITDNQYSFHRGRFDLKSKFNNCGYFVSAFSCASPDCGEVTLDVTFGEGRWVSSDFCLFDESTELFNLRPASHAKPQPDSVPAPLAKDYYEACAIRDLSPKASATLSRRVLQGMIRDFCKINAPNLYQEIELLKKLADEGKAPPGVAVETVDAMHSVRSIGNIGAHMEKDIDVVVDVDPNEAQALIELIEMLFEDWYIERAQRQRKLAAIKSIADQKADKPKKGSTS